MTTKTAIEMAIKTLEGINVLEAHSGKSKHREWPLQASVWLYSGDAIAVVNEMDVKQAIDALVVALANLSEE